MNYYFSGETASVATARGYGSGYSKIADVQDARLTGYVATYVKSGGPDSARYSTRPHPQRVVRPEPAVEGRDAIRRGLKKAEMYARNMEVLADGEDKMELSNTGFALLATLGELWGYRDSREDDWGDLLNLLQGALTKDEFERYSVQKCVAIRTVIIEHLGSGITDEDDVVRSIELLREAGLDPWKGISGSLVIE